METEVTKKVIIRPGYVGGYRLGNLTHNYIQFDMTYKPKWLHRQMMRIFFGWYWVDNNL